MRSRVLLLLLLAAPAAAGKFPGGFLKREGRPTMKETLTSRLMDRPIRPLFPDGFYDEVQIQASVLSSDKQNDGDVLAMNGASAALCISPLPFRGPLGSVRLAQIDGRFVPFPTQDQLEESDLDLIVSGSETPFASAARGTATTAISRRRTRRIESPS